MSALQGLRRDALACHAAALAAARPGRLVHAVLACDDERLCLRDGGTLVAESDAPATVLAVGKAAAAMAEAAAHVLGARRREMLVILPHGAPAPPVAGAAVLSAGHPVPDAASEDAAAAALGLAERTDAASLLLVLLSGGASALLAAPAPGVTLADLRATTRALLAAGADIDELNAVRKHCSRVKGGGLLRSAAGAAGVWTLALSDVVGDDLSTIGSGPTVADPSTYADALRALDRSGARVPPRVRAHLEAGTRGEVPETLAPGDPLCAKSRAVVIGGNGTAVAAAASAAAALGYEVHRGAPITGDAADAGRALVGRLAALPRDRAVALVAGGEPTVRVVAGGRGGRAQHLALAAALAMAGEPAVLLAAGTDGIDGPTDAAGAVVDGELATRLRTAGLDGAAALSATNSHPLLDAAGALLRTGPSGTNVADLVVALRTAC